MIEVVPLKYGPLFKKVFGKPEIFSRFASDVLDIPIKAERVYTEYEYPEPVGFVRSQYDLFAEDEEKRIIIEIQHVKEEDFFDRFLYYHLISLIEQIKDSKEYCFDRIVYTIVVLTSILRDKTIDFSYAATDWNPVDEFGRRVLVYPHRMIFLAPRLVSETTPPKIRQWLKFIADSLDGKVNEENYAEEPFSAMLNEMRRVNISPTDLAKIKDDAAWEKAVTRFIAEGRAEGEIKGQAKSLLRLLERKFSPLPNFIREKISTADSIQLDLWFERSIDAINLESVFTNLNK